MADHIPEEAKNFKLLGHDSSAAWGGGSIVEIHKGFAYVGAVGSASYNGPEGFTVHDVRDPRKPKKVAEVKSPPGVHSHKLRVVDGDFLYVNSERLGGDAGRNARTGLFIFDISKGGEPKQVGFYDLPGTGPHRFGVDNKRKLAMLPNNAPGWNEPRDLDARHQGPAQARDRQPVGPALDEGARATATSARPPARGGGHPARPADDPRQPHVLRVVGRRHLGDRLLGPRAT